MEVSFMKRHPAFKDILGILIFIVCILVGTLLINAFIFRSFSVVGPSMENTLHTGDRLIVNRLPVTWALLQNKQYVPERGQIIVFRNPKYDMTKKDEYIVKRVIAFPGERVTVSDGVMTVYDDEHPEGFNPDDAENGDKTSHPMQPTSGDVDMVVPSRTLFVSGDHRQGDYSYDSRNGLGTIPYYDVVGPVGFRIFPVNKIRTF